MTASGKRRNLGWVVPVISVSIFWFINAMQVPEGSHCIVSESVYGVRDLDKTHDEFTRAQKVNDDFGIAELVKRDVVTLVPAGTHALVLDGDSKLLTFYRRVRILDGAYIGRAVWVKRDALQVTPAPPASVAQPPVAQPSMPETCRDPHERLGSAGVCFCEPGYTRDPTTLKCIFDAAAARKKYKY